MLLMLVTKMLRLMLRLGEVEHGWDQAAAAGEQQQMLAKMVREVEKQLEELANGQWPCRSS